MIEAQTVDALSTIKLLELIEALYPLLALIHVFLENASYHHAKIVREWLAQPGRRIKLHFIPVRLAGCWADLRRRFFDLHVNGELLVATATVEQMKQLWAVEDEVRGQPPQLRLAARKATSADIV